MTNWNLCKEEYKAAYCESGISLKHWCKNEGFNYQNARKHIKVSDIQVECGALPQTKRQNVIQRQPQKANQSSFKRGNQLARKHGAYAELLNESDLQIAMKAKSLDEELLVCRSRLVSVLKSKKDLEDQIGNLECHDLKVQYVETLLKLLDAEDRTIARIESLHSTRSKLSRDAVSLQKDKVQTELTALTIEQRKTLSKEEERVTYHIEW